MMETLPREYAAIGSLVAGDPMNCFGIMPPKFFTGNSN